jgi:hypothetical protein
MVVRQDWITMCQGVKDQCIFITKGLITELNKRFSTQELMDDIGIIYLQYWVQVKVAQTFPKRLKILKTHFTSPRQFNRMANHMHLYWNKSYLNNNLIFFYHYEVQ